mmetsp:Transcript_50959/g.95355  ORF Transcript_50959/g.95355 Transcript_50959/m.95355 type:complete len:306 (-) Transcript_50959:26-943(-)
MEPQLDEELAWEPGWACPACTLVNDAEAMRCVACDSLRSTPGRNTSGVVVVLPREPSPEAKKHRLDDQWACPACTLLNSEAADACAACGSQRWVSKRPRTAAALRAARRETVEEEPKAVSAGLGGVGKEEHGIWGGLGPDREFLPLPPAPEGRVVHRSAKDTEVDIFADMFEQAEDQSQEPEEASEQKPPEKPLEEVVAGKPAMKQEERCEEEPAPDASGETHDLPGPELIAPPSGKRPIWRIEGAPLFAADSALELLGLSEEAMFEDAVGRLALSGFEITKCYLALEAAGGDESLARQFLLRKD